MNRSGMRLLTLILFLAIYLSGCGGGGGGTPPPRNTPTPTPVSVLDTRTITMGQEGGTIASQNISSAPGIEIPSGVLTGQATVNLEVMNTASSLPANTSVQPAGNPVRLSISGADVADDAQVIINTSVIPASDQILLVGYYQDGEWIFTPANNGETRLNVTLPAKKKLGGKLLFPLQFMQFLVRRVMDTQPVSMSIYRYSANGWGDPIGANNQWEGTRIFLLVHGFTGNNNVFTGLADHLLHLSPGCGIYAIQYDLGHKIDNLGTKLSEIMNNSIPHGKTIDIIAHSMGGLVARSAVEIHEASGKVARLITLGTPHNGIARNFWASLIVKMGLDFTPEILDLLYDSGFLETLNQPSYSRDSPFHYKYYAISGKSAEGFAEEWFNGKWSNIIRLAQYLLLKPNDGLVESASAEFDLSSECNNWVRYEPDLRINHLRLPKDETVFSIIDSWLAASGGGTPPSLTLNNPVVDQTTGLATVFGTISGSGIQEAIVIHNGKGLPISVSANGGSFSYTIILANGNNTIMVRATNAAGTSDSRQVSTYFTPSTGDFYFRVTLVWDGSGDVDLHTWDPNKEHSCYYNKEIYTGELDVDNMVANGPENFSCRNLSLGRYRLAVNAWFLEYVRQAFVRVSVNYGVNAGKSWVFGPYSFTQYNNNGGYPINSNTTCWWRPCDIVVFGNDIHPVNADSYYLDKGKEESNSASWKK